MCVSAVYQLRKFFLESAGGKRKTGSKEWKKMILWIVFIEKRWFQKVLQCLRFYILQQNPVFIFFTTTGINIILLKWHTLEDIKQDVSRDFLKSTLM